MIKIAVGLSQDYQFHQISFVNGIYSQRGGTHVSYVLHQICKAVAPIVNRRHKDILIQPSDVKNYLFLVVNCLIENPCFDSQTKESLSSRVSTFGSTCTLPSSFLTQLVNEMNLVNHIVAWIHAKHGKVFIERSQRGHKTKTESIPKLEDALFAGGPKANETTLIVTEGDSAKALAVSGLSVLGREKYGVFPLRGKMLNVRDTTKKKVLENEEIRQLEIVLGLNHNETYEDCADVCTKGVRYGKVMLMTDQDYDGFHIKGLFINYIHRFWPALLKKHNFLQQLVTPIVKVSRGKEKLSFYTMQEYQDWCKKTNEVGKKAYSVKYYKGLGTSTSAEGKEYFRNLKNQKIDFVWEVENSDQSSYSSLFKNPTDPDRAIDLAFSKQNSDMRKSWLLNYTSALSERNPALDAPSHLSTGVLPLSDFVHKELIQYSHADNIRTIPSVMDGLKPGQRKVLYACFKRGLTEEMKVSQLSGYVR